MKRPLVLLGTLSFLFVLGFDGLIKYTSQSSTLSSLEIASKINPFNLSIEQNNPWYRLVNNYGFEDKTVLHPKVQHYVREFTETNYAQTLANRSVPYLSAIVNALEEHNLPGELAFVPFIESQWNPKALSPKGAAGLWQMMPLTAKQFGIKHHSRYDITASTNAALKYFDYLGTLFNDDWLLALAAYNSGEGRVQRSMNKNNSTDFWALRLPRETRDYVPKILALAEIFSNPKKYGITLPNIKKI
jgi:membrane-bound lytic murein transglycosylase D